MNNYTTLTRYKAATPRSARRQKGYTVPTISLPSGNSVSLGGVVMLSGEQTITSIKDYLAGIKIGGLLVYSSKPDTIFVDANLAVRGAITMYADNGQAAPSIWDGFPYDDDTIKRNAAGKFYADVDGGSGTGGLDYEMLDDYLTINRYITSSALEPYALKSAIPTNTNQLTNGAGFITGITSSMVTNALGYTPLSTGGGTITATGRRQLSLQSSTDAQAALWLGTGLEQFSKGGFLQYDYSNGSIALVNFSAMANSYSGLAGLFIKRDNRITVGDANLSVEYDVLHSGNYSEYAVKKNMGINTAIADNEYGYGYFDGGWPEAGPAMVFGVGNYKAGVQVGAFGSAIRYGYTAGATSFTWRTILDDNNFSNYALPLTGGTVYGDILVTGAITMYYSSDERLKKNIRKVNASEVLMSLGGVWQYEYIDSEVQKNSVYDGTHFGLIYQNVKGKSLDKMCHKREDGMGSLNYVDADFISIIAGATMENISEIEQVKRENRELRKELEQLKQRVA